MRLVRRRFLHLAAGAAALPLAPRLAMAQDFPSRPVHVVVGFPPGGVGDIAARLIAQSLQQKLGQNVIVDNHAGAGGNVGTQAVVGAAPDGYTLLLAGSNNAINATLYETLPFNFTRDIAMVAGIMRSPLVMLTDPSFAATTVAQFIAYAKANPGKIDMASSGNGTASQLAGELFKMMASVSMVHVPYRGEAPALADLVAARAQVMFANLATASGFIRDGRLRALAVTTAAPWPSLPGVPPLAATVPGYEVGAWFGLGAPKATPAPVIAILNKGVNASLAEPAIIARIQQLGAEPLVLSPSEADAFVSADTAKWATAVKYSGAKVD